MVYGRYVLLEDRTRRERRVPRRAREPFLSSSSSSSFIFFSRLSQSFVSFFLSKEPYTNTRTRFTLAEHRVKESTREHAGEHENRAILLDLRTAILPFAWSYDTAAVYKTATILIIFSLLFHFHFFYLLLLLL